MNLQNSGDTNLFRLTRRATGPPASQASARQLLQLREEARAAEGAADAALRDQTRAHGIIGRIPQEPSPVGNLLLQDVAGEHGIRGALDVRPSTRPRVVRRPGDEAGGHGVALHVADGRDQVRLI